MFIWFAQNRANYNKGQVFPFLIAGLAILIIMAMITANLGKLSIFKTDASNAADAGSLAGASILSGWLLGIGLNSDTWCGTAVVTVARMMEIDMLGRDDINIPSFSLSGTSSGAHTDTSTSTDANGNTTTTTTTYSGDAEGNTTTTTTTTDSEGNTTSSDTSSSNLSQFGTDLVACIKLFLRHLINYYIAYMRALADGMMAWSNAKQTALRAAFQNSGVDEQPQTANKFKHYGGSYDSYVNDFMSQEANMTGFSQFMQHAVTGYGAPLGEIAPGELSDLHITSGYGWTQHEDESFTGSFPGSNNYQDFDNYVEVQVYGSMMYPLEALTFADYFGDGVVNTLTAMVGVGSYLKYIGCMGTEGDNTVNELKEVYGLGYLLAALYCVITAAAFRGMVEYLPCGFTFTDRDIAAYTTNNPIAVEVKRHKKNTDMGMWNFQYGNVIAKSAAHAFQESSDVTIEPVLLESMKDLGSFLGSVGGSISPENWASPNMIITIVQGALCLGAVGTMGGLIAMAAGDIISNIWDEAPSCDWDDWDCVVEWLAYAGAAAFAESMFAGGPGMVSMTILQYIIYMALCTGSSSYQPQSGDATMNAGALGSGMDWFRTDLHLFETELYSGYIQ